MNHFIGKSSILFHTPVYIRSSASVVSQKEGEGPLKDYFDLICPDSSFGADNWEAAESSMQKDGVSIALSKESLTEKDIQFSFGGDLLAQTIASSFGAGSFDIPYLGLYGACSTIGESLILGGLGIAGNFAQNILCFSSSHFASVEKEFRFPLGYGNQRPFSSTWTVTGCGSCILSSQKPSRPSGCAKITGVTIGRIVDSGLKDSMNMGGCMAPAAYDTISRNFSDFHYSLEDYDAIITGDLGVIGKKILMDFFQKDGIDISEKYHDCGLLIYDNDAQDTHAGGSGAGCAAVVFASYLIAHVAMGTFKRVLFVPTGALLSKVSFNEGQSIPGIAHAVVIEHCPIT